MSHNWKLYVHSKDKDINKVLCKFNLRHTTHIDTLVMTLHIWKKNVDFLILNFNFWKNIFQIFFKNYLLGAKWRFLTFVKKLSFGMIFSFHIHLWHLIACVNMCGMKQIKTTQKNQTSLS